MQGNHFLVTPASTSEMCGWRLRVRYPWQRDAYIILNQFRRPNNGAGLEGDTFRDLPFQRPLTSQSHINPCQATSACASGRRQPTSSWKADKCRVKRSLNGTRKFIVCIDLSINCRVKNVELQIITFINFLRNYCLTQNYVSNVQKFFDSDFEIITLS